MRADNHQRAKTHPGSDQAQKRAVDKPWRIDDNHENPRKTQRQKRQASHRQKVQADRTHDGYRNDRGRQGLPRQLGFFGQCATATAKRCPLRLEVHPALIIIVLVEDVDRYMGQ